MSACKQNRLIGKKERGGCYIPGEGYVKWQDLAKSVDRGFKRFCNKRTMKTGPRHLDFSRKNNAA